MRQVKGDFPGPDQGFPLTVEGMMANRIYTLELQLNKAITSDTEALF